MTLEQSSEGIWSLKDGVWVKSITESTGITIRDSVVTGDVIQNIIINDQDYVLNAVEQILVKLGFDEGKHPSSLNEMNRIQLGHTLTLVDAVSNENITFDGWLEISLGYACELENDLSSARIHFEKAMKYSKSYQDQRLQLHAKLGIVILDLKLGKLNAAEKVAKIIRWDFKKMGDKVGLSNVEEVLGLIAYSRGNYTLSKSLHEEALAIRKSVGYDDGVVSSCINLGNVAMSQGKVNTASDYFEDIAPNDQSDRDEAQLLCSKGVNEMQKGNISRALILMEKSLTIRREINDKTGQAECYNYMGTARMMQGDFLKGRQVCREALKLADEINDSGAKAHALYHIGQASIGMGDLNSGVYEIKKARTLFSKSKDRAGVSNCNKMLRQLEIYDLEMILEPKVLLALGAVLILLFIVI